MTKSNESTVLTGLLDFYSDRATAHASFTVAGIFGIYAVLFATDGLPPKAFLVAYVALLIINVYSFLNFGYYALLADIVRDKLENKLEDNLEFGRQVAKELKVRSPHFFKKFKSFKFHRPTFSFLFMLWSPAVIVPFFWKLKKLNLVRETSWLDVENWEFWLLSVIFTIVFAVAIYYVTRSKPKPRQVLWDEKRVEIAKICYGPNSSHEILNTLRKKWKYSESELSSALTELEEAKVLEYKPDKNEWETTKSGKEILKKYFGHDK